MYTGIINPSIDIYDAETNEFLGEARFELSSEAERKLLDLVNDRKPFTSLVVLDLQFQPAGGYVPLDPYKMYRFKGLFRALFTKSGTGVSVPIEMRGAFNMRLRSIGSGQRQYLNSVDFSNIEVDSIQEIFYE